MFFKKNLAKPSVESKTTERRENPTQIEKPNVSVVISTYNRADIIGKSIHSLNYQDYDAFELIIVNGPSTDQTNDILSHYQDRIKLIQIGERNLSKARNAGIAASSGEIIVFLDDDAFAEPGWISNIVEAYSNPRVAGVGTRVWNHEGFVEQQNPRLIDEHYNPVFGIRSPLWAFEYSDSQTIPHILGASSSFRRDILNRIGGFDEEIEYFLDESEVCRRIAELGYVIRFLESGASVHHKYSSGVVRDERKLLMYPYPVVKNKFYVCLSDARRNNRSLSAALRACNEFSETLLDDAKTHLIARSISPKEFIKFKEDLLRGVTHGRSLGLHSQRKKVKFDKQGLAFKPFRTLRPPGGARNFCFICRYLPQRSPGGIAKFTYDLAKGFAALGHNVTIITETNDQSEVLYQDGIWIRQLSTIDRQLQEDEVLSNFQSSAGKNNFIWSAMAYKEILRIRRDRPVDLVVAPIWNTEGMHCVHDKSIKSVITLQTTFKTYADIEWRNIDATTAEELLIFERDTIKNASYIHAISKAINDQVYENYKPKSSSRWLVAHLGIDEIQNKVFSKSPSSGCVRITYISRLEQRKGTDIFLAAAIRLAAEVPSVEIEVIGRDAYASAGVPSIFEGMLKPLSPAIRGRFSFRGEVSEDDLLSAYYETDIFCVPSRFESFGLIYLEAMRAGKPVVACNVGGVPEVVVHGTTGLLVPPDDVTFLFRALQQLVRDKSLREKLGKAGYERFKAHFTTDKMVGRTLEAYKAIIDG